MQARFVIFVDRAIRIRDRRARASAYPSCNPWYSTIIESRLYIRITTCVAFSCAAPCVPIRKI
jgi:hypothetical protein